LNDAVRYGDLTYREIDQLPRSDTVVVLPAGCTEQQGPHLPVDFDTWFAESLMTAAADEVERRCGRPILVLPAIPLGPTPEHRSFGTGYLDLPEPLHDQVVTAAISSILEQEFRHVIVWRGCGQHDLHQAVTQLRTRHPGSDIRLPDQPFNDIWCSVGDGSVAGGHADSFTTAVALARRHEMVRTDLIPGPSRDPDWTDPDLDFANYSDSGVIGDPRHATADLGDRLWKACVDWVADYLTTVGDESDA